MPVASVHVTISRSTRNDRKVHALTSADETVLPASLQLYVAPCNRISGGNECSRVRKPIISAER